MSKLYKWDKKDLRTQFFKLKDEIKNDNFSLEQTLMQEYYLEAIIEMIETNKFNFNLLDKYPYLLLPNKTLKKTIKDSIKNYSTKYQKDIIKQTSKNIISKNEIDIKPLIKKNISVEKQIQFIKNNFSNTTKLSKAHDKLFNPNNHLLKITKKFGEDAFWNVKNNGYISNINNQTIIDFVTLCHEIGHYDEFVITNEAIDKKINAYNKTKLNNYTETYSIFYELLSVIILYNEEYINDYESSVLLDYIKDVNTYNIEYFLLATDYVCNNKNVDINPIRTLTHRLSDLSMYYYSYIIAKELFKQYLNDKEKAFYNLNYLIKNITPNNEKKVLKYCDIDLYNFNDKNIMKKSKC